jgi:phosphate transport system substrate-binding protein
MGVADAVSKLAVSGAAMKDLMKYEASSRPCGYTNRKAQRPHRILVFVGLLFIVFVFSTTDGRAGDESQAEEPVSIEIRGTGAVLPLAQHVAELYMADHPDEIVVVASGGNRRGLKSLILGTCEMAMAATELPSDLAELAAEKKVELVSSEVFQDAVVPVVHPKNPIKDISIEQLRDIFRGVTVNWLDLTGKDAPITVLTPSSSSATFDIFKKAVLGDDAVITPKAVVTRRSEWETKMTEDAIGYTTLRGAKNLKILTVGGVAATIHTIASLQYPIRRTLRLYQRKPVTAQGKKLLQYFLAPDKGQAYVRELGDVPVKLVDVPKKPGDVPNTLVDVPVKP